MLYEVITVPYLGYHLLPDYSQAPPKSGLMIWLKKRLKLQSSEDDTHHHDIYNTAFYRLFRRLVTTCVRYKKTVILITLAMFVLSIIGFGKVQQQFFPDSTRLELVVDMRLAERNNFV